MTGRVRLVLVRHGESVWNVEERYQGQADSGLTAAGVEQAEVAAAELLAQFGTPDLVVTSDLPRARDTAGAYLRHLDLGAKEDARLREVDVGTWTGRTFAEVAKEYPDDVAAVGRGVDLRRGGGETFAELRARVWPALVDAASAAADAARRNRPQLALPADAARRNRPQLALPADAARRNRPQLALSAGGTVVVFTHGGVIRVAAAAALRLPVPGHLEFAPPVNASLTVISYAGERERNPLVEYNSPTARAARATRAD